MAFYDDMAAVANSLISEFGATITLQRKTDGTFDKTTGVEAGGSTALVTLKGIVSQYKSDLIDGQRIQSGDRMLILDNTQIPVLADKVLVGSEYWSIVDIVAKNPAGTPLVYFVQARK